MTTIGIKLSDNEVPQTTSLLDVMKEFIEAVNDMDETVLIPSRLQDMKADTPTESAIIRSASSSTMSVTTDSDASSSDDESTSKQERKQDKSQNQNYTLRSYYSMLKAVKTELVRGTTGDDDTNGNTDNDEVYDQCATAFKKHLIGLYTSLQQMTDLSKQLTSQYQQELGDNQKCIRPKTFTV